MLGENLRNLEYAKGSRHFEDEISPYAKLEDLDEELLEDYKKRIGAEELDTHQVLSARGFLQNKDGKEYLTNAAVLLFAKNIMQFYPNCRVRFLRIDGRQLQVGAKLNVVKDKSIDLPILRIIDATKSFVADQLRVFTT
jgi:ATP-dependent DNA helicase RecG